MKQALIILLALPYTLTAFAQDDKPIEASIIMTFKTYQKEIKQKSKTVGFTSINY